MENLSVREQFQTLHTQLSAANKSFGQGDTPAAGQIPKTDQVAREVASLLRSNDLTQTQKEELSSQFHAYLANREATHNIFKNVFNAITRRFTGTQKAIDEIECQAPNTPVVDSKEAAIAFLKDQKDGACAMWRNRSGYQVLYKVPGKELDSTPGINRSNENAHVGPSAYEALVAKETLDVANNTCGVILVNRYLVDNDDKKTWNEILERVPPEAGNFVVLKPTEGNLQLAIRRPDKISIIHVEPHGPNALENISRALANASFG